MRTIKAKANPFAAKGKMPPAKAPAVAAGKNNLVPPARGKMAKANPFAKGMPMPMKGK